MSVQSVWRVRAQAPRGVVRSCMGCCVGSMGRAMGPTGTWRGHSTSTQVVIQTAISPHKSTSDRMPRSKCSPLCVCVPLCRPPAALPPVHRPCAVRPFCPALPHARTHRRYTPPHPCLTPHVHYSTIDIIVRTPSRLFFTITPSLSHCTGYYACRASIACTGRPSLTPLSLSPFPVCVRLCGGLPQGVVQHSHPSGGPG
jgi:hypothetical protein